MYSIRNPLSILLVFYCLQVFGQTTNCSVNAGSSIDVCQGNPIELVGNIGGEVILNTIRWELISQPTGSALQILNNQSLRTNTSIARVPGAYVFRLTADCEQGTASQEVRYEVLLSPVAEAEPISNIGCLPVNTAIPLTGSRPLPGQDVSWEIISGLGFLSDKFSPDASFTPFCAINTQLYNAPKEAVVEYIVMSEFGCDDRDTLRFSYDIQPEQSLVYRYSNCDSCGYLRLSDCMASDSFRLEVTQMPEEADIDQDILNRFFGVCNVPTGEYSFRLINWGRCGVDTLELTQFIEIDYRPSFPSRETNYSFCLDEFPDNFVAEKLNVPSFVEGVWEQSEGPPVTIVDSSSLTLQIEGLVPGNYSFLFLRLEYECVRLIERINIRLIESPEIKLRSAGLTDYDNYCVDLVEYNGGSVEDTIAYRNTVLNFSFEVISAPPEMTSPIGFLINESLLPPTNLDTVFLLPGMEQIFSFENPSYQGLDNLFSMRFVNAQTEGNYRLRVGTEFPCDGWKYDEVDFKVIYKDSFIPNAGTDQLLPCGQDSTALAGNLVNGRWTLVEQPSGVDPPGMSQVRGKSLQLTDLQAGTYCFNYTGWIINGSGCNGQWMTDEVKIIAGDQPPQPFELGGPDTICGVAFYTWYYPDGIDPGSWTQLSGRPVTIDDQGSHVVFSSLEQAGSYSFSYTVENGCGSFVDSLRIVVKDILLNADILTRDSCISFLDNFFMPISLEASDPTPGSVGRWSFNGVGQASFSPNDNASMVEVDVSGRSLQDYLQFLWTVEHPECPNSDTDTLIWKQNDVSLELKDNVYRDCAFEFPDTLTITAGDVFRGPQIEWRLVSQIPAGQAPQLLNPQEDSLQVVFFAPGMYDFVIDVDLSNGCQEQVTRKLVNVRLSQSAGAAYAGLDQVKCGDPVFSLQGQPDSLLGEWEIIELVPPGNEVDLQNMGDGEADLIFRDPGVVSLQYGVFAEDPDCGLAAIDEVSLSYFDLEITEDSLFNCGDQDFVLDIAAYPLDVVRFELLPPAAGANIQLLNNTQLLVENLPEGEYQLVGHVAIDSLSCEKSDTVYLKRQGAFNPIFDSLSLCFSVPLVEGGLDLPWYDLDTAGYVLDTVLLWSRPAPGPANQTVDLERNLRQISYSNADLPGLYVFRYLFSQGVCQTYIDYRLRLTDSIFIAFPDTLTVCRGDSISLQPNPQAGVSFEWSPPEFLDDSKSDNPVWSGTADQWIYVNYFASGDTTCFNQDSVFIDVLDPPIYDLPEDSLYCSQQELSLMVETSSDTRVSWYSDRSLQTLLNEGRSIDFFLDSSRKFYLLFERNGCTILDSIDIVLEEIELTVTGDTILCTLLDSILLEIEGDLQANYSIEWADGPGVISNRRDLAQLWVRGDSSAIYELSIQSANGCGLQLSTQVDVSPLVNGIDATADPPTILPGSSSQLNLISDCNSCATQWMPEESLDIPTGFSPLASPAFTTSYTVEQRDGPCVDTAQVTVAVLDACKPPYIYIPTAFTPDGDELNDVFRVVGPVIEEIHVRIYNRWGEKVFETRDINQGWDGTFRAKKLNPDVFGYVIEVGCVGGERFFSKGNVTILY